MIVDVTISWYLFWLAKIKTVMIEIWYFLTYRCLMIIVSKSSKSKAFYENLYALQERLKQIDLCCGRVISGKEGCSICGLSSPLYLYSPLALKNNTVTYIFMLLFYYLCFEFNLFSIKNSLNRIMSSRYWDLFLRTD